MFFYFFKFFHFFAIFCDFHSFFFGIASVSQINKDCDTLINPPTTNKWDYPCYHNPYNFIYSAAGVLSASEALSAAAVAAGASVSGGATIFALFAISSSTL